MMGYVLLSSYHLSFRDSQSLNGMGRKMGRQFKIWSVDVRGAKHECFRGLSDAFKYMYM